MRKYRRGASQTSQTSSPVLKHLSLVLTSPHLYLKREAFLHVLHPFTGQHVVGDELHPAYCRDENGA